MRIDNDTKKIIQDLQIKAGNRIKELRAAMGKAKTQERIAEELGLNLATYKQYETPNSRHINVNVGIYVKIAHYHNVSLDYLLGLSDHREIPWEWLGRITGLSDGALAELCTTFNPVREYLNQDSQEYEEEYKYLQDLHADWTTLDLRNETAWNLTQRHSVQDAQNNYLPILNLLLETNEETDFFQHLLLYFRGDIQTVNGETNILLQDASGNAVGNMLSKDFQFYYSYKIANDLAKIAERYKTDSRLYSNHIEGISSQFIEDLIKKGRLKNYKDYIDKAKEEGWIYDESSESFRNSNQND